jgi:hypothetical protein
MLRKLIPGLLILGLVGCQSISEPEQPATPSKPPVQQKPKILYT